MSSVFLCSSSTILIILVFLPVSCAIFTTDIRLNINHINNRICINFPAPDTITLEVTQEETWIVSVMAKKDVVIINKNKKLIKESFSLAPKYDKNKFLNLKLKFHHNKISIDTNTINIVLNISGFRIHIPYPPVHLKEVTFKIGKNNNKNNNINKYHTKTFSCLLYLLNL
ncbi:MAG: hypothetical protein BWY04_01430 [candidate division CPR1 bacterium ADurb.Bin160]|uniref:Uncharacterized protein n=1 Tax=candidate division CPR1 bacterium ADurb.Bin160 TaxID=1852826 RepID=A0A1V5ZJ00_9BACT|nr:MAG: hypothetical protein BWY04_01430 [candidate division CPR1 bacterium ADurb.Bin160]